MVAVKHLPFSFDEKVGFVNYYHRALNLATCRVPRTSITHTFFIFIKGKKDLIIFKKNSDGRVSICFDI